MSGIIKPNIMLNLDVGNFTDIKGDCNKLNDGTDSEYITSLIFVLPINQKNYEEGFFQVEFQGKKIDIRIFKVQTKSQDPFFPLAKDIGFGTPENIIMLPFYAISDNKGKYPCFYAELIFPYRLAHWSDSHHRFGIKDFDAEEVAVTGPVQDRDKIIALIMLNKLFSSTKYTTKIKTLNYEDVTVFLENYFIKNNKDIILQKLNYFTSQNAYKDAVTKYFLDSKNLEIPRRQRTTEILSEDDLMNEVVSAIDTIKHYVENRYCIQPYWDGFRTVNINGEKIEVPANPKNEKNIQPTLELLFALLLSDLGIHVVRETDEGVGILDFRCLYTTQKKNAISISIEFKLAQNKKIKHGLIKQLPSYLQANRSNSGIYIVMWFKDENATFFKQPSDRNKSEMIKFLKDTSKTINKKTGLKIETILIDASIKPSASSL